MKLTLKLKNVFVSKNFLRFCVIGTVNTLNNAFISWLLHHVVQDNVAAVIGFAVSLTVGYFLNCHAVFRCRPSFSGCIRFWISYIPNFVIYFLVTFITINTLSLPQFAATFLAAMTGGPVTFIIIKLYAFKNKN